MSPSIWQILIVVALVFLLFGAGRLPRVMEDIAKGITAKRTQERSYSAAITASS